jgi:hypothetical protein
MGNKLAKEQQNEKKPTTGAAAPSTSTKGKSMV